MSHAPDPIGLGHLLYGFPPPEPGLIAAAWPAWTLPEAVNLAHAGCAVTAFCRNPLHPGPCKGWKKKLGTDAPGILNAIESARKEKLAAKRKATAEAKGQAGKNLTGKQAASPLHAKKATVKAANQILGDDEEKAAKKAGRVILNKTEIKKYSRIKAAQITQLRDEIYGIDDPEKTAKFGAYIEGAIAQALADDNVNGRDTAYQGLLNNLASGMASAYADKLCKEHDGDCDGELYEALSGAVEPAVWAALVDGRQDFMKKVAADFKAGKIKAQPPEPEAKAAAAPPPADSAKSLTVKQAGLQPADKAWIFGGVGFVGKKKPVLASLVVAGSMGKKGGGSVATYEFQDEDGEVVAVASPTGKLLMAPADGGEFPDAPSKVAKAAPVLTGDAAKADAGMKYGLGLLAAVKGNKSLGTKAKQAEFAGKIEKALADGDPKGIIPAAAEDLGQAAVLRIKGGLVSEPFWYMNYEQETNFKNLLRAEALDALKGGEGPHAISDLAVKLLKAKKDKDFTGFGAVKKKMAAALGLGPHVSSKDATESGAKLADKITSMVKAISPDKDPKAKEAIFGTQLAAKIDEGKSDQIKVANGKIAAQMATKLESDNDLDPFQVDALQKAMKAELDGLLDDADTPTPVVDAAVEGKVSGSAMPAPLDIVPPGEIVIKEMTEVATPKLAADISPEAKVASDLAHGFTSGTAKQKLAAYEKLSAEDFAAMTPGAQKLIMASLDGVKEKFLDPKKKAQVQQVKDKLSVGTGGGAGAGGAASAPAGANAAIADKVLALVSYSKGSTGVTPEMKATIGGLLDSVPAGGDAELVGKELAINAAAVQIATGLNKVGLELSDLPTGLGADLQLQMEAGYQAAYDADLPAPLGIAAQLPAMLANVDALGTDMAPIFAGDGDALKDFKKAALVANLEDLLGTPTAPPTPAAPAGTGGSTTAPNPAAAVTTPSTVFAAPVGTGTEIDDIPLALQNQITDDLKGFSKGKYLADPKEVTYVNLLTLAAVHGTLDKPLSVLQVLKSVDNAFSKKQGWTNTNNWEKEFVAWLGTPAGAKFAADNPAPDSSLVKKLKGVYDGITTDLAELAQKVPLLPGPGEFDQDKPSSKFKFTTANTAYAWKKTMLADQGGNYTPSQLQGIKAYTGSAFYSMNSWLRGQEADLSSKMKSEIKKTQDAMRPLPKDTLLIRGTGWNALPEGFQSPSGAKKLIGKTVMDEAFMSTSVGDTPGYGSGHPLWLEIEAPAGTQAAFVEGAGVSSNPGEREMLLAAGQQYRILSVEDKGGRTHVRVRIVTPGA